MPSFLFIKVIVKIFFERKKYRMQMSCMKLVCTVQFASMPTMKYRVSQLKFNAHNDFVTFIQKTKTKCSGNEKWDTTFSHLASTSLLCHRIAYDTNTCTDTPFIFPIKANKFRLQNLFCFTLFLIPFCLFVHFRYVHTESQSDLRRHPHNECNHQFALKNISDAMLSKCNAQL